MAKAKFNDSTNSNRNGPGGPGGPGDPKKDDALNKLTEVISSLNNSIIALDKKIDKSNKASEKTLKATEKREKEQKELFNIQKQNSNLRSLESLVSQLSRMKNLSVSQRGTKKDLSRQAKDLQDRALQGEDVSEDLRKLQFEKYKLDVEKTRYNQSAFGLLANAATTTPKTQGFMSMGLGLLTGINPVFAQLFGLDKAAKWAGGKALDAIGGMFKTKKSNDFEDEEDDGLANGTEKLKSKNTSTIESIKESVKTIAERLDGKKEQEEKKEDESGGVLSFLMKAVTTILGVAATGAVSLLMVAGRGMIGSMIGKALEATGLNEELARSLGGTVADMIPGAILGAKFGGLKGALIGAGISLAYFTLQDKVKQFKDISEGKIPDHVGPLSGDILKGAMAGAAIGAVFGPVGIVAGAVIGAGAGWISNMILASKIEAAKEEADRKEKEKTLDNAASKGIKYDAEKGSKQAVSDQDLMSYMEAHPEDALNETRKEILKTRKKERKEADSYEKDRKKVEEKAKKKYGTSDLTTLNISQLEEIMDDDDAEFEAYLNELSGKGYLVNDEETRRSLRAVWKANENLLFGENKDAKKAVFNKVHSIVSQSMPTEQEIISDGNTERTESSIREVKQTISDNKESTPEQKNQYNYYSETKNIYGGGVQGE